MQILKTTPARATVTNDGSNNTPPVDTSSSNSDLSDLSDVFTGSDPATQETAPIDTQSIDFLFGGSIGGANGPSSDQFAPNNVVTLDEWLMEHPEGRMFLDQFITKMKTVRDKFLIPRKERLEKELTQRGLRVSEAATIQAKIDDLTKTIAKVNGEIGKAEALRESDKVTYQNELYSWPMRDLNGDGYIGDPSDPENSFIIAKHPVTGQEVILDAKTKQPAIDPYLDMKYEPALIDEKNVSLISREQADQNPGKVEGDKFDIAMKIKNPPAQGLPSSTFGAQIDMVAPEGFWVEKDPATGKPILLDEPKKGEKSRYKLKAFTTVTREDGKKMIGQETPTASERGKYVFVRVSSMKISSEPITFQGKELDAGHVYIEYKNKDGETIAIIRVEGTTTTGSPLAVTGTNYIAATSVGVALTSGKTADDKLTKHSSRISPIEIDASDLSLTSKILSALPGNTQEIEAFYNALGIPSEAYDHNTGEFLGDPEATDEEVKQRSKTAGNFTLSGGFLSPMGNEASTVGNNPDLAAKFGYDGHGHVASRGVYLPNDPNNYRQFRESITGITIIGFRGSITGTQNNDIIVVPPPDEEAIRELLPIGAKKITPDNPAYGTYVDAGRGRNFVYSGGGDIAVKSASFFWQEDKGNFKGDTDIYLDNSANNTPGLNHAIFVHTRNGPKNVNILNVEDSDTNRADKDNHDGVKDDYYSGPASGMKFTHLQNDIPAGLEGDNTGDFAAQIKTNIDKIKTDIQEKVIRRDPLAVEGDVKPEDWEYGKQYEEWAKISASFYDEWESFHDANVGSEETEGVLK